MSDMQKLGAGNCRHCGEALQSVRCECCGGRGFVKNLLIESACSGCGGTGEMLHCPNELQHLSETEHAMLGEVKMQESHFPPLRHLRPEKQAVPRSQREPQWKDET